MAFSMTLPVLLQLSSSVERVQNPEVGQSGLCDENHLLHLRNDPHNPSFVALVAAGPASKQIRGLDDR